MMGKLTLAAFDHSFVQMVGVWMMELSALAVVALLFYLRRWKWLFREWITSLDPKKIGVMYLTFAAVMLFKGISDAILLRAQQVAPDLLSADHYQQIFTAHGATMIFFVGMGVIFGMMNLLVPLQIGARDVAFPFLNAVSFWLFFVGGSLLMVSMIIGDFSATGWVAYPPLSGLQYSPGEGVDYWIWSVQVAGVGSLLGGINFFATIVKMRCPGMTLMRMPLFTWSILATVILILFAFPILTATVGMLSLDRLLGMRFFTPDGGGNPMMYINLIWAWGHPEVYILVLPSFGVFSEVVSTFSQKKLFGYNSMVWAIIAITFLSFIVWLHHFFTMGAGGNVNAFFGIMTMIIAVPTGVKIFNWLFTLYRGRVQFTTPMLWFLSFATIFTVGGMAGMLLSIAPVDFQVHNSLFLIAHFHSMVIGAVLFGFFAAVSYWFPKFTGFKLNERLGHYSCVLWSLGFFLTFMPLYLLGLMGATRRLDHTDPDFGWSPLFWISACGAFLVLSGVGIQTLQLAVSIWKRKENRDLTGNPWNGKTLEWSISSPPPLYNFAVTPVVYGRDPLEDKKEEPLVYEDVHLPKHTPLPFFMGMGSFLVGFGLVWHMFWLAIVGLVSVISFLVIQLAKKEWEECIPAAKIREESSR